MRKKSYMNPKNLISEGFFKSFWRWFTSGALDRAAQRKNKKSREKAVKISNKKIDKFEKEFEKIWGTKLNLQRLDASDFMKKVRD